MEQTFFLMFWKLSHFEGLIRGNGCSEVMVELGWVVHTENSKQALGIFGVQIFRVLYCRLFFRHYLRLSKIDCIFGNYYGKGNRRFANAKDTGFVFWTISLHQFSCTILWMGFLSKPGLRAY